MSTSVDRPAFPCPKCGGRGYVKDSRSCAVNGGYPAVRRRRRCNSCGHRWLTWETIMAGGRVVQSLSSLKRELRQAVEAIVRVQQQLDAGDVGLRDVKGAVLNENEKDPGRETGVK